MKAVLCKSFDGAAALELGETEAPQPADDEILIDVRAAPVSYMDMLMAQGQYQMRPELPYVPGTDAAGVVVGLGAKVSRFELGDRVTCMGWFGAFAERMVAKEWKCVRLPDAVEFSTGSTVLHNYITAYYALVERAHIKKGESLFVTGAAGGVGLATVDMARLLGAKVIAGIGDESKREIVQRYGAVDVVNYQTEDIRDRLKFLTNGQGVDVCFEMIGGEVFMTMGRLMAWGGRLMPIGFAGGDIPSLPMNLPLLKNYSVVGVFAGAWLDTAPSDAAAAADKLMQWVAQGELHPQVHGTMPLEDAAKAMQLVADRKVQGRVVLTVGPG